MYQNNENIRNFKDLYNYKYSDRVQSNLNQPVTSNTIKNAQ